MASIAPYRVLPIRGRKPKKRRTRGLTSRPPVARPLGPRFLTRARARAAAWPWSFPQPLGYDGQRAIWRDRAGNYRSGTAPEYAIFWALERRDAIFTFQSSLFGGQQLVGGVVADFIVREPIPNLIIRVQGVFWHFGQGFLQEERDESQKVRLMGSGYQVIDIDSDDALADPLARVDDAFALIDTSRGAGV